LIQIGAANLNGLHKNEWKDVFLMDKIMAKDELFQRLKTKPDVLTLAQEITENPHSIADYLEIINYKRGSVKFLAEKVLRSISETDPDLLYPYFSEIAELLDSQNSFIKWGGIITLSNLVVADRDQKFLNIYDRYFSLLNSETMVTAANVAGNAWKIVERYPEREADITRRLLSVENNIYYHKGEPSPECNNVLYGHLIDCFVRYFQESVVKPEILAFVSRQQNNPRKKVAKAAQQFVKKYGEDKTV
jgi:hypothetical protein